MPTWVLSSFIASLSVWQKVRNHWRGVDKLYSLYLFCTICIFILTICIWYITTIHVYVTMYTIHVWYDRTCMVCTSHIYINIYVVIALRLETVSFTDHITFAWMHSYLARAFPFQLTSIGLQLSYGLAGYIAIPWLTYILLFKCITTVALFPSFIFLAQDFIHDQPIAIPSPKQPTGIVFKIRRLHGS